MHLNRWNFRRHACEYGGVADGAAEVRNGEHYLSWDQR
jgi:hypothetical protein